MLTGPLRADLLGVYGVEYTPGPLQVLLVCHESTHSDRHLSHGAHTAMLHCGALADSIMSALCGAPIKCVQNQCVIPISMAISYLWLGTRYRCQHYLGMVTVRHPVIYSLCE